MFFAICRKAQKATVKVAFELPSRDLNYRPNLSHIATLHFSPTQITTTDYHNFFAMAFFVTE